MNRVLKTSKTLFISFLAVLFFCTKNSISVIPGGGGSETVNARVIAASYSISVSVAPPSVKNIEIGIFAVDFNPLADTGFSLVRQSFDSLHYAFKDSLREGLYNVLVRDTGDQKAILFRDIALPSLQLDTMLDTLSPTASVSGTIVATGTIAGSPLAARINGTPLWARADSTLHFSLIGIPSGNTTIIISADKSRDKNTPGPLETTVSIGLDPGMAIDSLIVNIGN